MSDRSSATKVSNFVSMNDPARMAVVKVLVGVYIKFMLTSHHGELRMRVLTGLPHDVGVKSGAGLTSGTAATWGSKHHRDCNEKPI